VKYLLTLILLASSTAAQAQPPARDSANFEPWAVFFDWGKARIEPQAAAILDNFAEAVAGLSLRCTIEIMGHTDRSGPDDYNLRLGLERARAVAHYLRQRHVAAAFDPKSFGETRPLLETPDGAREAQNRRVEWNACM
jgi:outer membrane protein OmpA-like peptidoglycan-associated protein